MEREKLLVEKIKELKNTPAKEKYLAGLRYELIKYMSLHPAQNRNTFWRIKALAIPLDGLKNFRYLKRTTAISLVVFIVAGTSTFAAASQNSLPGQTLYPVKILAENVRSSLVLSPISRAKLESEFAAQRVNEVKAILENDRPEQNNIEIAMEYLRQNTSRAASIIETEKLKGTDVSDLAKYINDDLDKNREILDDILENHNANIKKQQEEIRTQIGSINQISDAAQANMLAERLKELTDSEETVSKNFSSNKKMLEQTSASVAKHMDEEAKKAAAKKNAERLIDKAKKAAEKKQKLSAEAKEKNLNSVSAALEEFNLLFDKANISFTEKKYGEAAQYAQEAAKKISEAENKLEIYEKQEDRNDQENNETRLKSGSGQNKTKNKTEDSSDYDD